MISKELEVVLHQAFMDARAKRHEFITIEHLLTNLLNAKEVLSICGALDIDINKLRHQLSEFVDKHTPVFSKGSDADTQPTLGFQRVIQRAIVHVQSQKKESVTPADTLVAIFGEKDTHAVAFLEERGLSKIDLLNFLASGVSRKANKHQKESIAGGERLIKSEIAKAQDISLESREVSSAAAPKLFISYCHADLQCLERLLVHLRPLERAKAIACWSDRQIRSGDRWRKEIEKNLDDAAIAILLVSADFLASDFIVNNELPPLLVKAELRGIRILPVLIKPCGFKRDRVLSSFQAVNDPAFPLLGMSHIEQESIYNKIADEVDEEIQLRFPKA